MSIQNALNAGMFSKLSGGTALVTSLGGTFIYFNQAPDDQSLPYVVWSYAGGVGHENITPSESINELLLVRGYAANPALAGTVDGQISALLHKQVLTVTGYTNFWTAREQAVHLSDVDDAGLTTWTSGAFYRVRLDQ